MNISMNTGDLLSVLRTAYRVADNSSIIPSISSVLLYTSNKNDAVGCRATDFDVYASATAPANVSETGSTVVQAKVFYEIIRSLPAGSSVTMSGVDNGGGKLKIASGRSKFELDTLISDQFPAQIECDYSHSFTLKVCDLIGLFGKTEFSMIGRPDPRYFLEGIFLHARHGMLRAVATDGYRMALAEMPNPPSHVPTPMPGMIVPRKAVSEVLRLCKTHDGEDEQVEISASPSMARFIFGGGSVTMTSKLIDGIYPEYERVIPKEKWRKQVTVRKKDIIGALVRVSKVCADRKSVKLSFGNTMKVSSIEIKNTAIEEVDMVDCDNDLFNIEICLNPFYFLEAIENIDGNNVLMKFIDQASPVVLQDRDADPYCGLSVIMPMRG